MSREIDILEKSFQEMLEESFKNLVPGDKVTGIVVAISPTEIQVELGTKYPGYILPSELNDSTHLKVGDDIDAYVVRVSDRDCMIELSQKRPCTKKRRETVKGITNSDTREICEVVCEEVLEEVRYNLSQMKPELVSSIVDMVVRKVDHRYSSQIEKLEKRISEIEKAINRIGVKTK